MESSENGRQLLEIERLHPESRTLRCKEVQLVSFLYLFVIEGNNVLKVQRISLQILRFLVRDLRIQQTTAIQTDITSGCVVIRRRSINLGGKLIWKWKFPFAASCYGIDKIESRNVYSQSGS